MRAPESNTFTSAANANSPSFLLMGGTYHLAVKATSYGTVELQRLGPDATTWLSIKGQFNNAGTEADLVIGSFGADGSKKLDLGPGNYRWTCGTVTNIFAELVRIPSD